MAAVRQVSSRLQGLLARSTDALRNQVVPAVKTSYTDLMAKNAEFVVKDPAAAEKLGRQFLYTKLASIPQRYVHAQSELEAVKQVWAKRSELPLSEVGWYGAFAAELFALFCVGEIVGRGGSLTEYSY